MRMKLSEIIHDVAGYEGTISENTLQLWENRAKELEADLHAHKETIKAVRKRKQEAYDRRSQLEVELSDCKRELYIVRNTRATILIRED